MSINKLKTGVFCKTLRQVLIFIAKDSFCCSIFREGDGKQKENKTGIFQAIFTFHLRKIIFKQHKKNKNTDNFNYNLFYNLF